MNWTLYRWAWRLESSLFVGAPPAGSLNRSRLYVPSRALWGALTAELARRRENGFPSYETEGTTLHENARFTYLFPAECEGKYWRAWLPRYEERDGLVWRREDRPDGKHDLTNRQMRLRLLDARPGTAIDPDSDCAEEGSLRETECVLPQWRSNESPVAFVGYVFLKQDSPGLRDLITLFLGGDTRYGLGRLRRLEMTPASEVFGAGVSLNQDAPLVQSGHLLAHARPADQVPEIVGSKELLAGWDRTKADPFRKVSGTPLWTPGSRVRDGRVADWAIGEDGIWTLAGGAQ
ncbi:MAG TPA: hypothetical protein VFA13_00950 [Candidatus Acidoferrum sp.]|nr:hypothetical protein [Candidatus Acidoferrum sp.]